jgi:nitrogen-specific signal transduction histidine kinase
MKAGLTHRPLNVLLITEKEQEFILIRDLLSQVANASYEVHWIPPLAASSDVKNEPYEVCLFDYHSARDLAPELLHHSGLPLLLLLEQRDICPDLLNRIEYYLLKEQMSAPLLKRCIDHAIERKYLKQRLVADYHKRKAQNQKQSAELQIENKRLRREVEQLKCEIEQCKREASALHRRTEERFRVALKNSSLLLYHTDRELRYTWAFDPSNENVDRQFVGKRDDQILPAEDVEDLVAFKQAVLATGAAAGCVIRIPQDGKDRYYAVTAEPLRNGDGHLLGLTGAALDITERKQLEEGLRTSVEKIKFFAYSVSHDLKGPAVGIHGLACLLSAQYSELLDERGRKYCDQILQASEQTVTLLGDLNAYILTKESPLRIQNIKLKEFIREIKEEFAAQLTERRIVWAEPNAVAEFRADRLSLLRAFRNLVDNALKYGGAELSRIAFDYEESTKFHIFSVADNGMGIQAQDFDKVFRAFQRNSTSKGIPGTGLGLAIVQETAKRHFGKSWLEQRIDRGTKIFVTIAKGL